MAIKLPYTRRGKDGLKRKDREIKRNQGKRMCSLSGIPEEPGPQTTKFTEVNCPTEKKEELSTERGKRKGTRPRSGPQEKVTKLFRLQTCVGCSASRVGGSRKKNCPHTPTQNKRGGTDSNSKKGQKGASFRSRPQFELHRNPRQKLGGRTSCPKDTRKERKTEKGRTEGRKKKRPPF